MLLSDLLWNICSEPVQDLTNIRQQQVVSCCVEFWRLAAESGIKPVLMLLHGLKCRYSDFAAAAITRQHDNCLPAAYLLPASTEITTQGLCDSGRSDTCVAKRRGAC